jgi:lambda repressor-like predicted transcriptional regulator
MYFGAMQIDDEIKKKLVARIEERELKLPRLSKQLGTSYSTLWNFLYGQTINFSKLPQLAKLLDFSLEDVFRSAESNDKEIIKNKLQPLVGGAIARIQVADEQIPIYGPSPGGGPVKLLPENIVGYTGTFTDHVQRHTSLIGMTMIGDAMYPRRKHGWLVRLAINAPPQIGEDCALQMQDNELRIFEFVRQTGKEYVVKTLKPEKEFHFQMTEVKAVHLVIR